MMKVITLTSPQQTQAASLKAAVATAQAAYVTAQQAYVAFLKAAASATGTQTAKLTDDGTSVVVM